MKWRSVFIAVVFALGLLSAAYHSAAAEARMQFDVDYGSSSEVDAEVLPINPVNPPSGGSCDGGQCNVVQHQKNLSCPTSGGPTCAANQTCYCQCKKADDGTFFTVNVCT